MLGGRQARHRQPGQDRVPEAVNSQSAPFPMVDNQQLHRTLPLFQLQPELLLKGGKQLGLDGRPARPPPACPVLIPPGGGALGGGPPGSLMPARPSGAKYKVNRTSRQSGHIHHGEVQLARQSSASPDIGCLLAVMRNISIHQSQRYSSAACRCRR